MSSSGKERTSLEPARATDPRAGSRHPLSHGQQALWALHRLAPLSCAYNMAVAFRIRSKVDVSALDRAFQLLSARHASLRTTYGSRDGVPFQLVHEEPKVSFERIEASGWSERRLAKAVREKSRRPFHLTRGPVGRVALFSRSVEDHVLLFTLHHIAGDLWSISVLLTELGKIYPAEASGREWSLPSLPMEYTDYVRGEAARLQGEEGERLWAYWKDRLSGELSVLDLPTDRSRPPVQTFRGDTHALRLDARLIGRLEARSREHGVTLSTTLLAAFQVLLHRYTGQEEIALGLITSGRTRSDLHGLVGYFVNPVVVMSDFSRESTGRELLSRVGETVRGALAHQAYPFPLLAERLSVRRDPSRSPLFQVLFSVEQAPLLQDRNFASLAAGEKTRGGVDLGGLRLEPFPLSEEEGQFDLTVNVAKGSESLTASFQYNTDLFRKGTIAAMAGHFERLLEGLADDPEKLIGELPLLSAAERQEVLSQSRATFETSPSESCVHQLFEARASDSPDAIALESEEESLTYGEMNARANRLAHFLKTLGVGLETPVGVLMTRSCSLAVSLLGILKAGGAYLPIDPSCPEERLDSILAQAQVSLLVTQEKWAGIVADRGLRVVCLDSGNAELARQSSENPDSGVAPENLAYIIFTSGSTGKPKGVAVEHRALVNHNLAIARSYALTPRDRVLQFSPVVFDVLAEELFPSWHAGSTVVLAGDSDVCPIPEFVAFVEEKKLTVLNLPAPYWHEWVSQLSGQEIPIPSSLRLLVVGSDRVRTDRFAAWSDAVGNRVRLLNGYGPTECTVTATLYEAGNPAATGSECLPIGRPIDNVETYVLDPHGGLVPVGLPGELSIGGAGLARGYLHRPDLTQEVFVRNPFSSEPGARLYRTGDRVRRLSDGNLEFLGRTDQQIKLRGFRIELGEIEAALRGHPAVRDAAVCAQAGPSGEKHLVGYCAADPAEVTATELKEFLKSRLPAYMLPSVVVFLERLPATESGKVNRAALPAPDLAAAAATRACVPPRTAVEIALAEIWAEVLGLERVSLSDNFFELGGDSILSLKVTARANRRGLRCTPKQIFEQQTLADLARVVIPSEAAACEQGPVTGAVPLTPIQRWFFEQQSPNPNHRNHAILFEARQALEISPLRRALEELVRHHDALRLRFTPAASGWKQAIGPPGEPVTLDHLDFSTLSASDQRAAMSRESERIQTSLDLSRGPTLRAALFDLGASKPQELLVVIHHLCVDVVSWKILIEDLQTAYEQLSRGEAVVLPSKTTSYRSWARRLTEQARSPELRRETSYWLSLPWQRVRPIPVDRSIGDNSEGSARFVSFSLDAVETRCLLREIPRAYLAQIREVLLAALGEAFSGWIGADCLPVDLEGHGREEIAKDVDPSRTVGWFTCEFPFLMDLSGAFRSGQTLLRSIKEQLRSVPGRGMGYGMLRYLVSDQRVRRKLKALPKAEVSFNYLGQTDEALEGSRLLDLADEQRIGPTRCPEAVRSHLLEMDTVVVKGRFRLDITYSENRHSRATIDRLGGAFLDALRTFLTERHSRERKTFTPSDFPMARLSDGQLQTLVERAERENAPVEDIYPLSPFQRQMVLHGLRHPASRAYFVQFSCELSGPLEIPARQWAWQRVIDRHPILRSSFHWEALGEPLQVVHQTAPVPMEYHDWSQFSQREQEERLDAYQRDDRRRGFDLGKVPLMRFSLIRKNTQTHHLIWSIHNLLLDGWSLPLIMKEVLLFYDAYGQQQEPRLPLSTPFRDYVSYLAEQDLTSAEAFWREQLRGFRGPTRLPGQSPVPPLSAGEDLYEETQFELSAGTTERLQEICRDSRVTLNSLVLGAWTLLLGRLSGQRDIVIGVTVSGRPATLPGVESIVGPLINLLPLRVRISPTKALLNWITELQKQQADLRQYEYSPLSLVEEWSEVPRPQPLFESAFFFQNYPVDLSLLNWGGFESRNLRSITWGNCPLSLTVTPGPRLTFAFRYDCRRLDGDVLQRAARQLRSLIEGIAEDSRGSVSSLLSPVEAEGPARV